MSIARKILMGSGGKKDSTYVDDVFSTYLWKGTGSARSITTGVDMTEGGLTWIRRRNQATDHYLFDTVRGATKYLNSNDNIPQQTDTATLTAFNNDGFSVGTNGGVNGNGNDFVGWSFRKASGFFDVLEYTGNGQANRVVTHNLGSVPGCIMIKKTSGSAEDWRVYHRGTDPENPGDYYLRLNQDHGINDTPTFMDTIPTSTQFLLNSYSDVNANGETYIAYIFAGGASTAATARSVDFNGSNQLLAIANSTDFNVGTNHTVECWFYCDDIQSTGNNDGTGDFIIGNWEGNSDWKFEFTGTNLRFYYGTGSNDWMSVGYPPEKQWHHIAFSKEGTNTRVFLNGTQIGPAVDIGARENDNPFTVAGWRNNVGNVVRPFNGKISNIRIVQGTALYTSTFRPPTEPLTNITNTKLLFCNNSSTTGSTVTPGTITATGSPTAKTNIPFDDLEGFQFGEEGDQNLIKCGSYVGNGSSTGPEINLGWEPQWLLFKTTASGEGWMIFDVMRGISTQAGNDHDLRANTTNSEGNVRDYLDITPTGFKQVNTQAMMNGNGTTYVYMAIRRSDGLVGKPVEAGTDVFAMDTGNSNADQAFTSGFPVDWAFYKKPASSYNWYPHARLTGQKYMQFDNTGAEQTNAWAVWDDMTGWAENTHYDSNFQSWMWKRHAGFDVVTWKGSNIQPGVFHHSLNKVPEMMWVRNRGGSDWEVYHKGLNGGSSPENYAIKLNESDAEGATWKWYYTAPTSIHFTVSKNAFNQSNTNNIAILFASVAGISKVGYYTGNGSTTGPTITTGFTPRFLIVKNASWSHGDWFVYDTTRGWTSGDDKTLKLNSASAQLDNSTWNIDPTSTGFTVQSNDGAVNANGNTFIYYAHA